MDHTTAETTAGAVRAEMARKRASIRDVADATKIPKSNLARRLNGDCHFTVAQIIAIARALDVPVTTLLPADERAA